MPKKTQKHKVPIFAKKCHQKERNRDTTHFLDKTAYNFAKILPEIGFFLHKHCLHVCTFFFISAAYTIETATATAYATALPLLLHCYNIILLDGV